MRANDWIYLAEDRNRCQAFVNAVINLWIPKIAENFLTSRGLFSSQWILVNLLILLLLLLLLQQLLLCCPSYVITLALNDFINESYWFNLKYFHHHYVDTYWLKLCFSLIVYMGRKSVVYFITNFYLPISNCSIFYPGPIAPSDSRPPHYRGFMITLPHHSQ
jgi:hypothetical protein